MSETSFVIHTRGLIDNSVEINLLLFHNWIKSIFKADIKYSSG